MKRGRAHRASCIVLGILILDAYAFQAAGATQLSKKISQLTRKIREAERNGTDGLLVGRMWERLAEDYEDAGQYEKAESAYNQALKLFGVSPRMARDYAGALESLAGLKLILNNYDAAESCRAQALSVMEETGDKVGIARTKALLAEVYLSERKYKNARQIGTEAYNEMVSLKDSDDRIVGTLVSLTFASAESGQPGEALERGRKAEARALSTLPADCELIGEAHMALGYAEWKAGMLEGPDEEMREGIRVLKRWTTPGHSYMVWALSLYSTYLKATHRKLEAKQVDEEGRQI